MVVETYSHVLHIVSQVSGTLRDGVGAMDALRAALPGGHALGRAEGAGDADHRRAGAGQARLLRRRDRLPLAGHGDLDTASTSAPSSSRTVIVHVQAGGGIVADAEPAYEYSESVNKAKAVFRAVELAGEQPDWP